MTTLSKLQQEAREEFERKFCILDDKLEFLSDWSYYDKTKTLAEAVQLFLTAQIKKAYLAGQQSNITTITLNGELPKERLPKGVEQEVYWKVRYEELKRAYKKAYLSALSDVEKGLPKKIEPKERIMGWGELTPDAFAYNEALFKVKEVINKLKQSK